MDKIKNMNDDVMQDPNKEYWIGGELGYCSKCNHQGCSSDIWNGVEGNIYCPNCGRQVIFNSK